MEGPPGMLAFRGALPYIPVHRNARMTEMERSGMEVRLVFADNLRECPCQTVGDFKLRGSRDALLFLFLREGTRREGMLAF